MTNSRGNSGSTLRKKRTTIAELPKDVSMDFSGRGQYEVMEDSHISCLSFCFSVKLVLKWIKLGLCYNL